MIDWKKVEHLERLPCRKKRWEFSLFDRVEGSVQIADELWFDTRESGIRVVHMARAGWYEHPECPGYRIFVLTLLWVSIKVGF